jgi:photosystem II stability/assembly factor-like uncharacterized protein
VETNGTRASLATHLYFTSVACSTVSQCEAAGYPNNGPTSVLVGTSIGTTWKVQAHPKNENVADIACPAKLVCEAVGSDSYPRITARTVARTTDGGNVWRSQRSSRDLRTVSCPTVDVCVAGGPGVIYTHDGGVKWVTPSKVNSWDVAPTQIACGSATDCVAIGVEGWYGGRFLLMYTTDGGVTWTRPTAPKALDDHGIPYNLSHVACATATYCVATAPDGVNIGTVNGGRTWQLQSRVSGVPDGLGAIACTAKSLCYALGHTVVFRRSS